jgi:hypothetical protein
VRPFLPGVIAGVILATLGVPVLRAQSITGTILGRVLSTDGRPVPAAEVTFHDPPTGLTLHGVTRTDGRFGRPGLSPSVWVVSVRKPGFMAVASRTVPLALGATADIELWLRPAALVLPEMVVRGADTAIRNPSATGIGQSIGARELRDTPLNGRNFTDALALSPLVQLGASGIPNRSGGTVTFAGMRRGATQIQIDGATAASTFFGGEPRGSDRMPFALSLEAIQELEIVAADYDVEYGPGGGAINAVTGAGTNQYRGTLSGFARGGNFTGRDFSGLPPSEFRSRQEGFLFSGPIRRNRMHFVVGVERQDKSEPVAGVPAPLDAPDPDSGIHPDSVARMLGILRTRYGVDEAAGRVIQTQDEWALFGRIDWQVSDRHHLTVRFNSASVTQAYDRIATTDLSGNGDTFRDRAGSAVVTLGSAMSGALFNELMIQRATEPRTTDANSQLPQITVIVGSDFGSAGLRQLTARCCNDILTPSLLEEALWELRDVITLRAGPHRLKAGVRVAHANYLDNLFSNQFGTFQFASLADLDAGRPSQYSRALPDPGPDQRYFTFDDIRPLSDFHLTELALLGQDEWEVARGVHLTAGLRLESSRYGPAPPGNGTLQTPFGLSNSRVPRASRVVPRLGLTWQPSAAHDLMLRAGVGVFAERIPAALVSLDYQNAGPNQLSLRCVGAAAPAPDYLSYARDPGTIPTACANGAGIPTPAALSLFDGPFTLPTTLKASLGVESTVVGSTRLSADVMFSRTTGNYFASDRNLLPEQFLSAVENRPVFAPVSGIRPAGATPGQVVVGANRKSAAFSDVLAFESRSEARALQVALSASGRVGASGHWQAGYTWTRSYDNASYSCCVGSRGFIETPTAGNPGELGARGDARNGTWGPADFSREHTLVLSGALGLPWHLRVGGLLRVLSGRAWTPIVDGDPNGDSRLGNDRAFVGNSLNWQDNTVDPNTLATLLAQWPCLRRQIGRIAERNSCRDGWISNLDVRAGRSTSVGRGRSVEVALDIFNLLNGLDSRWGRQVGVLDSDANLLRVIGFDPVARAYRYTVNPGFGARSDLNPFKTDQFSAQLGVRVAL